MSISISKPPQSVFPVYTAQVVEFTASGSEESVTITVGIDGQGEMTFVRDFYSSKVKFNLAGVVNAALDPYRGKTMLNVVDNAMEGRVPSWADAFLSASGWIQIASDEATRVHFTAVNASLPVGRPTSEFVTEGRCLSKFPAIKLYDGYVQATELCFQIPASVGSGAKVIFANGVNGGWSIEVTGEGWPTGEGFQLWCEIDAGGTTYQVFCMFDSCYSQEEAAERIVWGLTGPNVLPEGLIQNIERTGNKVRFYAGTLGTITGVRMVPLYGDPEDDYSYQAIAPVVEEFSNIPESVVTEGAGRIATVAIPSNDVPGVALSINGLQTTLVPFVLPDCIKGQTTYVRWINSLAGYDYYMFEGKNTNKRGISDQIIFKPYVEENDLAYTRPIVVGQTVSDTLVVGAQGLPTADFDILREITTSPFVQVYTQDGWVTVYVKNASVDKDSDYPTHEIEFELALPPLNLQF